MADNCAVCGRPMSDIGFHCCWRCRGSNIGLKAIEDIDGKPGSVICMRCGTVFKQKRVNQIYCSKKCKCLAVNSRYKKSKTKSARKR